MKTQFAGKVHPGDKIDDVFVLADKNLAIKKDGNSFMTLTLSDRTGQLKGVAWNNVDTLFSSVAAGDFVHVLAGVSEYRGSLQVVVKDMKTVPPTSIDPPDFLPSTQRDVKKMFQRLTGLTRQMKTGCLKKMFDLFWGDDAFVDMFTRAPAAKFMHHAFTGGLLEHTLSMALLSEKIGGHYQGVDQDLLLAGVILHDVGKIRELEYRYKIDYTDEGRLLSHIVIGIAMVDEKIRQVDDFPEEKANLLKHMIVSHHGVKEYGSPELPKTIEAVLLNYIDEIDSRVNSIREFIRKEDSDDPWTSYHRLLERQFYKGPAAGQSDSGATE